MSCTSKRSDLLTKTQDLFDVVASGVITIPVNQSCAPTDAARAHVALEARQTTGTNCIAARGIYRYLK